MISEELKVIIDHFKEKGKMAFFEGATKKQISNFERINEITLPRKYKEWLQFSDGGECFLPAGVQFYGVAHKPQIDVNDIDRPENRYIVIGALAMGDPILCEEDKERISIFNHEAGKIENDETYPDFFAFLNDLEGLLGIGD